MGSNAMTHIPSFIKIGSGIQKLIRGDSQKHRKNGDRISLLPFFQNKESRLMKIFNVLFHRTVAKSRLIRRDKWKANRRTDTVERAELKQMYLYNTKQTRNVSQYSLLRKVGVRATCGTRKTLGSR
jgi:hypothetical protein